MESTLSRKRGPVTKRALGDWRRNPNPSGAANRSCQATSARSEWEKGLVLCIVAGEGQHAFIMKLLPINLSCLEEPAHLFSGLMKPRLTGAQRSRHPQVKGCRRMAGLAGRSLERIDLLQLPFGHHLGEKAVGLA